MLLHAAFAFSLLPLFQTPSAQEPEAPTPTEDQALLKELEENLKRMDRELLELGINSIVLGTSEPWPPADPSLALDEWQAAIAAAPARSVAELVGSMKRVSVQLVRSTSLNAIMGAETRDWVRPVAEAVHNQGLQVDARGDVKLRVRILFGGSLVTTKQNGRAIGNYGAYTLRIDTALALPARILRGSQVHQGDVELVNLTSLNVLTEKPTRDMVVSVLQANIAQLLAKAAADQQSPASSQAWTTWAQDPANGLQRYQQFHDSYHAEEEDLDAGLGQIAGLRAVITNPVASPRLFELANILKQGALATYWAKHLAAQGVSTELTQGPVLRHDWILSRYTQEDALKGAVGTASRVAILEEDLLGVLEGQFVRFNGMSYVDRSGTDIALWQDVQQPMMDHLQGLVIRVSAAMRSGTEAPAGAQHKHAPAVANFLRTRTRTEVPDAVLKQLSNRIALALEAEPGIPASYREKWIETRDGQPIYLLPRVGDARRAELVPESVQAAVRRAIDQIEFTDPIALYAFDNPFHYNPDGDYTILPAEYPERFKRTRPAGRSSLAGEYVVNAVQGASKISGYYSSTRLNLGQYKDTFAAHKLLMASYHDSEDGPGSAQSQYFFWYGQAPKNWKAILAALPKGHGLLRIGPPCTAAPDTIQEAQRQLANYQSQLGQ